MSENRQIEVAGNKFVNALYEWKAAEEDSEDGSVDSDDEDMAHGDETAANSFGREDITNELDDNEDDLDDGKQYLEMLKRFQLEDGEDEGETAMEDYSEFMIKPVISKWNNGLGVSFINSINSILNNLLDN